MLELRTEKDLLILEYSPERSADWVLRELKESGSIGLRRVFTFTQADLHPAMMDHESDETPYTDPVARGDVDILSDLDSLRSSGIDDEVTSVDFILGRKEGEYYQIPARILGIRNDVFLHADVKPHIDMFKAEKNVSIMRNIDRVLSEPLYVGGSNSNAIPAEEFASLIRSFPNYYELRKYTEARLSVILRDYFDEVKDGVGTYEKYMGKKPSTKGPDLLSAFSQVEYDKYVAIQNKLLVMLEKEDEYVERQWQTEILQILFLIFPKYVKVFIEAPLKDFYANTTRNIDFMLLDSSGHVDIIEIKRPHGQNLVSKNVYRDNYIPLRELSHF